MPDPQDVDTLFPPKQPDVDTLFPPELEQFRKEREASSPIHDLFFGPAGTPAGHVLNNFGHGFKQAWGTEPLGLSDESNDFLVKSGMFNDYQKGQFSIIKAANEALFRPAAVALDAASRAATGLFSGSQEAVAQFGEETGHPQLGRDIAAIPEAFMGSPHPTGIPDIAKARSLGVIGEGEAGWKGIPKATEEPPLQAEAQAVKAEPEPQPVTGQETPSPSPVTPAAPAPAEAPATPDIHAVARQIAPETFQQYDALLNRQNVFRRWIGELQDTRDQTAEANAPHAQEIQDTIEKLNDPDTTPRLRKKYQARLDTMREDYDTYMDEATAKDSPDMATIRQRLQETDYALRDLAPDVGRAYRDAQAKMPTPEIAPEPAASPVPPQEAKPVETAANSSETPVTIDGEPHKVANGQLVPDVAAQVVPVPSIVNDVTHKLVAAGRPQEEAEAAAQLVSAYWQTRAERFRGAKGTADEMYRAESPSIIAGKTAEEKTPALAQTKRGRIRLRENGQNTITLLKDANASTFVHESAHDWLARMMSDARDDAAPDDLKTDANTIRDWVGADEGKDITTAQHEKFARGFERYLMEGTAPSQALANVFAKFKAWLTTIYQTVAKLRAPINDDIRDVFDRLLSTAPEKVVVAPEREIPKDLADRHETLAESTPPEKAHDTAEVIQNERDRAAKELSKEDQDARFAGVTGETEQRKAGGQEPHGDGNAPTVGAEPGAGEGAGTVGAGGDEAAQESGGLSGQPAEPERGGPTGEPGRVGGNRGQSATKSVIPTSAQELFPPTETPLVDKAGNFRMENINAPEDVKDAIRQSVGRNNEFMDQRRGVVSDAQALSLADSMGMTAEELDLRQIGDAFNKEEIVRLEKLFIQSATSARDAAIAAKEAGTDEAYMAYAEAESRQAMILDTVAGHAAGVRAEAGRALQAYNALKKLPGYSEAHAVANLLKESTGKTLYQIKERAAAVAGLETPAQVAGALRDMNKPGLGAMALEIFKNWLISGPITHSTYAIGNQVLALWKATAETAGEAAVGAIREAITGDKEGRAYFGEVGSQLYAMFYGQKDGWKAGWDSFKTGQTMPLPHEMVDTLSETQRSKYDALIAQGKSYEQAMSDLGVNVEATTPFTMTKAVPDFKVGSVPIPLGTIVRVPGERMVAPIHSYYRTIGYLQNIARQAYRMATDEGLTGNAFDKRMAELTRSPSEEMMTKARGEATQQTLMGKGGALTQRISSLMNWQPNLPLLGPTKPLSFIDPFVHIASNIMEQAVLERGPLGVLSEKIRSDLLGKNGIEAQNSAASRMLLGTSLSVVGGGLAMEGMLTSSAPSEPHEAAMWRRVHGMPHSFRIGEMSYDLSRLGVLGFQMGIAADLYHVAESIGKEDFSKIASLLVHSFAQNFLDEGFMRGPSDLIKALDDSDRYGASYLRNFVSSFAVPFSVGMSQIARQVDPYSRQARTLMDEIKSKVPWWSETLMPRRDIWGEPIPNRTWEGVYQQKVSTDPVDQALMSLKIYPAPPSRKIRGVELTDQQYDDFTRIAGRTAKIRLNAIVGQQGFQYAPPGIRTDMIQNAIKSSREMARDLILMQSAGLPGDDNILRKATQNKSVKRLQGNLH